MTQNNADEAYRSLTEPPKVELLHFALSCLADPSAGRAVGRIMGTQGRDVFCT